MSFHLFPFTDGKDMFSDKIFSSYSLSWKYAVGLQKKT